MSGPIQPLNLTLASGLLAHRLTYQRDEGPIYHLSPMGHDVFVLGDLEDFRVWFIETDAEFVALEGLTPQGVADRHERHR